MRDNEIIVSSNIISLRPKFFHNRLLQKASSHESINNFKIVTPHPGKEEQY